MATGFGTFAESRAGRIGPINLGVKQTGERRAGNPHAAFEEAGAGNVAWSRCCDTRRRKGEATGEHKLRPKPARQSPTLPWEPAFRCKGRSSSGRPARARVPMREAGTESSVVVRKIARSRRS